MQEPSIKAKESATTIASTVYSEDLDLSKSLDEAEKQRTTPMADLNATLPPTDSSVQAYLFLVGAFAIEAIMWGFPLTFGVFLSYYDRNPAFRGDRFLSVIGTLGTGIPFLGGPIITPITARWHRYQRQMIWGGWLTCIGSLVAASFATKVWHLIVTQGLAYGFGFLVLYYALLSMLNEWFVKRRGLAYGILFAAAGISGTCLPFLIQIVLNRWGFQLTLRAYAIAILVLIGPTLPLCRGRMAPRKVEGWSIKLDLAMLRHPVFLSLSFSTLLQGLAFFLPGIYLPSFATALKIPPTKSTLLLCLLNLAQVLGQILLGYISDKLNIFLLVGASTAGSAIVSCGLWLSASCIEHLLAFSVLYGLFAGGFSVLYARFVSCLTDDPAIGLWLYGMFAFQRGVGNIVSGPVSSELLKMVSGKLKADPAAAYQPLILFVGMAFVVAALGGVGFFFQRREKRMMGRERES